MTNPESMRDENVVGDSTADRDARLTPIFPMETIHGASVIVGGVGALGNEVLKNLVLIGVGRILVCDLDNIERHNLTRSVMFRDDDVGRPKAEAAVARARELNPNVQVTAFVRSIGELGLGAFRRVDVAYSTFDGYMPRFLMNASCLSVGTPWVDGGMDLVNHEAGEVFVLDARDPDARCFTCGLDPERVAMLMNRVRDFAGCGPMAVKAADGGGVPTTSMMASVIGGIQVMAGLAIVADRRLGSATQGYEWVARSAATWRSEVLRLDLRARSVLRVRNRRMRGCYHHDCAIPPRVPMNEIVEVAAWDSRTTTPRHLLERAISDLGTDHVSIQLPEVLVPSMECLGCGARWPWFRSIATLRMLRDVGECKACGGDAVTATRGEALLTGLELDSPYLDRPLGEIGIRPLDILPACVLGPDRETVDQRWYELTGDAAPLGLA